ncbi:response regulator [Algibacter miyuki]|uniref:histidine kinase n=1 Tax=Algibacter miyuki TaxID=1306933 RepID=A0ABV5H100_9FLAO|nr:response regulator [Algibacter miyuki]MDN3666182.1 response regulator [Algibacter miyuki]
MLEKDYHRLLRRQLKKAGLQDSDNPELMVFLNSVNAAYNSFDRDVSHLENILEFSSKELFESNKKLTNERDTSITKLGHVVDNIGGIIFETDVHGNFTYLNIAWEEFTGHKIKDSLGRNFKEFVLEKDVEETDEYAGFFVKKRSCFIFKAVHNEQLLWLELNAKHFRNIENESYGFIGSITDITDLKEAEIKLQKASNSKDEFISTMSHEIRTPLNAVTGLTNILLMEDYLPEQVENLKALKYSGEHLLGLINDLLDFDKIKSGKLKVQKRDFSLTYFLDNINSQFTLLAEKKNITFEVVKENKISDNIIGDKVILTQIIKNLLSNSFKFTEQGGVALKVKETRLSENRISLGFFIVDTGIGISKSKQTSIFDSFVQASSETAVKYGGTGLGLTISKRLLKLQNSDLKLISKLGEGSTFFFALEYDVDKNSNQTVFVPAPLKTDYKALNINVLVAEDNKMNVLIMKRFFANWKINYTIAENGEEALKHFKGDNFNFDLVLMDLQMPIMNGYQATKIIRRLKDPVKSNVPIIALTALAQIDIKEKTKTHKMNGFMGKPFDPDQLYALIKSYSR